MIHDCNSAPFPADIFFVTPIPHSDSVSRNSTHSVASMSSTLDNGRWQAESVSDSDSHSHSDSLPRTLCERINTRRIREMFYFRTKKTATKHSNKMSLRRIPIPIFINVSNAAFSMARGRGQGAGVAERFAYVKYCRGTGPGNPLSIIASQLSSFS